MAKEYIVCDSSSLEMLEVDIIKCLKKGRVVIIKAKSDANKTMEQMGYYHGVVLPIALKYFNEELGNEFTKEDLNQFFNERFFSTQKLVLDKYITITRSKAGATIEEMSEFLEKVIKFCGDWGIEIPSPPEKRYEEIIN